MITQLYKKSKLGKIQQWSIETLADSYRTSEGFIDGIQTYTAWTACTAKNIGRSNATTPEEQAIKEAEAIVKKQYERGWVDDVAKAHTTILKIAPMLAYSFKDHKDYALSYDVIASQPKYDGIRCMATNDCLYTRSGKVITAVPHIEDEALELVEVLENITGKEVKLDGELYNHELHDDFNTIISIVRRQNLSKNDLNKAKQIMQYHIYDVEIEGMVFSERFKLLREVFEQNEFRFMKCAPTDYVLNMKGLNVMEDIDSLYAQYRQLGYEGQMIRIADSYYENYRSKSLLKRKDFIDEEFTIVDIEEGKGNRSGMAGAIVFDTFKANIKGSVDYYKDLLYNKDMYIGCKATVRYQALTPKNDNGSGGVPRFPVVVSIRTYE